MQLSWCAAKFILAPSWPFFMVQSLGLLKEQQFEQTRYQQDKIVLF